MILALECSGDRVRRCTAVLRPRHLEVVRAWSELESAAPGAICSVVVLDELAAGDGLRRLGDFVRRFPSQPVVLATRGCMTNARFLARVAVAEVVWLADLEVALPEAVRRVTESVPHHALGRTIGGAAHLPRVLRDALAHACLAPLPVYSVAELAAAVFCDRTTLSLQWRNAVGPHAPLRLVDFLGLVLLLHAGRRRVQGRKWQEVAIELGVHEQTLRRLSARLLVQPGRRCAEAELREAATLLDGFVRAYLSSPRG